MSASSRVTRHLHSRNKQLQREELLPDIHPYIVFPAMEWDGIISQYAKKRTAPGSWSKHFLHFTRGKGPGNTLLIFWADLDTSKYTGESNMNRTELKDLAKHALNMTEYQEGGLFVYVLHCAVHDKII